LKYFVSIVIKEENSMDFSVILGYHQM